MRNEELIKTNSELDGFVYTVSHDIRAPLSSLKGLIALLKEEEDADTISHYIQLQEESVVRLDTFIKEISEYSRNRKSKLKKEVVNIDQLVQEVIEQHRYMPDYHRQVDFRMESEGVHYITSDRSRINLIINNLISNGIKYADLNKKRSYVAIRIKEGDAQELIIEVEDNGIGIKNEYQSRIFDMFYRINSKIEGTGIGLHIVKEAMERIGAKIEVQSVEGEGTTFRLILPSLNK
jgi:signal transduction histidine kinase